MAEVKATRQERNEYVRYKALMEEHRYPVRKLEDWLELRRSVKIVTAE